MVDDGNSIAEFKVNNRSNVRVMWLEYRMLTDNLGKSHRPLNIKKIKVNILRKRGILVIIVRSTVRHY